LTRRFLNFLAITDIFKYFLRGFPIGEKSLWGLLPEDPKGKAGKQELSNWGLLPEVPGRILIF
jgi:hypothetical protein